MMKEALNAYMELDWEKYRGFYYDSAGIYQNQSWINDQPGISPDEMIASNKEFYSGIVETRMDDQIWEMVITGNGFYWVHFWGIWSGKFEASGNRIEVPIHASFNIMQGKIATEVSFFDNLKIYLEQQAIAIATAAESPEESSEADPEE